MSEHPDCLFCKIVSGQIPTDKVAEDEHAIVFKDISPQAPTHLLIIPKVHVTNVAEVTDPAVFSQVLAMAQKTAKSLGLENFRLAINNGAGAGQSVFHLHVHLLSGRTFHWPPG